MLFKDNSQIGYLRSQMFSALSLTSFLLSFFSRFFSKFSAIALFVVLIVNVGLGQTNYVSWGFTTALSTGQQYAGSQTNMDGARTSALTSPTFTGVSNTVVTSVAATTFHRTTGWPFNTASVTASATSYVEFTITLASGQVFDNISLSLNLTLGTSNTGTGPNRTQVIYGWGTSPSFSTEGAAMSLTTSQVAQTAITIPAPGNTTTTKLTIRLASFQTTNTAQSGNFRISSIGLSGASAPLSAPTLTTPTATSIATTSATLGATVTSNGGASLTARGTVWGTSASPTGNSSAEGGTTVATFSHSRTGLTANTLYYYRGYATNSAGTGYSGDGIFTTLPLAPTVGSGSLATSSGFTANWTHPTMGAATYTYTVEVDDDNAFGSVNSTLTSISSASTSQAITGLSAGTTYYYRVKAVNSQGSSDWSTTSAGITTSVASTPTITTSGTLAAVNTTYGTASASPTNFSVSGSALTNDITITPPSGYEISTSLASGYATSLTLAQGGGSVSSTTIYVRLAAITAVGSYSGNISVASTGATTQNVATVSSTVSTKSLTITGLTASNKVYDATTSATLTGTAAYSGLVNGESFSVSGTPSATFATKTVGTGKAVTVIGYTAPSANYTVTQPTGLTATITAKTLTVTGAAASNKTYDGTTTATISGTLSGVIAGDVVTLTGTGTFASANVGTGIVVTSTSTLAGADNANYTLTQPTGLAANITQASQTIVFGALPGKTTADAAFACGATSTTSGTNALTYSSSNTLVATINASGTIAIVGAGTTTITVYQAGSANYSAAADVAQTLTVNQGPCGTETFTSSNATASYTSSSFTGDNGVTWTYTQSQDNSSYQINGASLLLRRLSDNSKVVSGSVSGGIGNFTCKLLKGYTGAGNRQVALYINNIFQANSTAWDNTSVQTFTVNDINIAGSVVIEIRNITANQVVVDDISWTCYTASPVPQAVSSSAATSVVNTTAILNGNLTTVGVAPNTTEKGFVYSQTSTNSTPEVGGTGVTKTSVAGISTGAYTLSLAGLITSTGYSFRAYAYDGTNYTYGSVLTFTTLTVATKLGFGTTPPAVGSISTNLTTFTVQALRSDNTLDTEFSGSITVAKASGPGNIAGTLTATASSGVATFSSVQFDALGDYTIIASSGALTTVTSGTISILAYAVGDYRTKQNGNWGTSSTWEKWDGSAWSSSSNVPNSSTANVFVLHTVDVNGSGTPPWDVNNLTVQLGGKLWCNSFSGNNDYIQVYGDILCDGTIGSTAGDDICFDIAGGNDCNISGTGSFTASRLRKDSDINTGQNSNVTIDMDVRLTWSSASGTVLYNNSGASSDFNVTINTGKNLRCSGPGSIACNVSIDGVDGAGSGNRGGTYTVYGTLDIDGALISMNDNTFNTKSTNVIVENGGALKCRYINTGASTNSNVLRVKNTGKLTIFGSVDTITASLNDITWNGYSATNNTWDFQSGSTIEYSGATQQRLNGITTCSNFIVSGGGLKKLGNDFTVAGMLTLTNGRIQTDAYKLIHTSTSSADLTHTTGSSSFIFGTYRRYIASNSSTYELPVGLSSATSGYRRADIINNNLSGVTYIDASVRSITETANNIDSRLSTTQIGSSLTDVLGASVWSLVPNAQPSAGTYGVKLYVSNSGLTSSDDNTFCAVKRNDNSTDYADWNTFYASTTIPSSSAPGRMYDAGNGYAQRLGYTTFSEHALGKTPSLQPLPIELNMFDAFCQEKGKTAIKWATATEHNSSYFQLDRSDNGLEWQILGSIGAAVNSDEEIQYNFEDRNQGGLLYYRLHQLDINGGEQMYGPISVNCETNDYEINTFPNPSGDAFHVSIFSETDLVSGYVQVVDAKGMVVYFSSKSLEQGSNEFEIMCEKWLPGVYFIEVIFEDGNMYRKKHIVM